MDNKRATLLLQAMEVAEEAEKTKETTSKGKTQMKVNNKNQDHISIDLTKKGPGGRNPAIVKAIDVAREHPNITIHSAELKAFFLWLESKQKDNGNWITLITRNTLLQACPIVYPEEWSEFQEFLQKNNIVFRTRSWKLS
jgi:hypothetical protein